jgi:3-phenylpropionate/trans-cinnamate dioxygenase ferredoxin component
MPSRSTRPDDYPTGWALDGGPADALLSDGRTLAHFADLEVLVVRTRRGVFAFENRCPHMGRHLGDAPVSGRKVICKGHNHTFDLGSGKPKGGFGPGGRRLRTFDVTILDGRLWLAPKRRTEARAALGGAS